MTIQKTRIDLPGIIALAVFTAFLFAPIAA